MRAERRLAFPARNVFFLSLSLMESDGRIVRRGRRISPEKLTAKLRLLSDRDDYRSGSLSLSFFCLVLPVSLLS